MFRSVILAGIGCFLLFSDIAAQAQTNRRMETVQRKDGAGDGDEKGPLLTASWDETIPESGVVLIKVAVSDDDPFPRVEFFVKNQLFAAQARAPYGVFIGEDIHKNQSFDVVIEATDNYGNRTRANIIVRDTGVEETYDCTFSGDDLTLKGEKIEVIPTGGSGLSLTFDAVNTGNTEEGEDEQTVEANVTVQKDGTAAGTVTVKEGDDTKTYQLTGTAEVDDADLTASSFDLTTEDEEFSFVCS